MLLNIVSDIDLSNRSYDISFNSGAATFSLEVADDDLFENKEFFVIYMDVLELQDKTSRYASLVEILDNEGI